MPHESERDLRSLVCAQGRWFKGACALIAVLIGTVGFLGRKGLAKYESEHTELNARLGAVETIVARRTRSVDEVPELSARLRTLEVGVAEIRAGVATLVDHVLTERHRQ